MYFLFPTMEHFLKFIYSTPAFLYFFHLIPLLIFFHIEKEDEL